MKIIPTKEVVIEQLKEPITAWTVLIETRHGIEYESMFVEEPMSGIQLYIETATYKYIGVADENGFSIIDGFRCYETETLAEFVKRQYTRTTNIPSWVCPVALPEGCHVIRNQGVIFSNEFTVYSSLNTMPNGVTV